VLVEATASELFLGAHKKSSHSKRRLNVHGMNSSFSPLGLIAFSIRGLFLIAEKSGAGLPEKFRARIKI
jgi:hypothetical protein